MKPRSVFVWLAVIIAAVIYFLPAIKGKVVDRPGSQTIEGIAPAFSLAGLDGRSIRLSDFGGKIVLINFWASWCPPCREEIPGFEKVYRAYKDRGFTIIGIAADEVPASFISEMDITYPLGVGNSRVAGDYGVRGIPASFLVAADGRMMKKVIGVYPEAELANDVARALKES